MKRPKHILIYDNGGTTADRYTVIYTREPYDRFGIHKSCLGMSAEPFAPHGICMHGGATIGPHLGKQITWNKLPADCQRAVIAEQPQTPKSERSKERAWAWALLGLALMAAAAMLLYGYTITTPQ